MSKRSLYILVALFLSFVTVTYGKWEYLTWKHSAELKSALQDELYQSDLSREPLLLKVIRYTDQNAQVFTILWQKGGGDRMFYLRKESNGEWKVYDGELCTTSNGLARCFFPWYSPIRSTKEQTGWVVLKR